jgi:hypothetical protein
VARELLRLGGNPGREFKTAFLIHLHQERDIPEVECGIIEAAEGILIGKPVYDSVTLRISVAIKSILRNNQRLSKSRIDILKPCSASLIAEHTG